MSLCLVVWSCFVSTATTFAQRQAQDRRAEAAALNELGLACLARGETQAALRHLRQAEELSQAAADWQVYGLALGNIGRVYYALNEWQKALVYQQRALEWRRELADQSGEAQTLAGLGQVYLALKRHEQAIASYAQALAIRRAQQDQRGEAGMLVALGKVYLAQGEPERAAEQFTRSLGLWRKLGERQGVAEALYQLARLADAQSRCGEARERLEQALEIVESLRESFLATAQDYYQLYVRVLMQQHQRQPGEGLDALALAASERARARGAVDVLAQAGAANVAAPRPLQLSDIQRQLPDDKTLLLEYALGSESSYLWVVSKGGLRSYCLPPRDALEEATRRVYQLLATQPGAEAEYWQEAQQLSEQLLGPAAGQLSGQRLLIVPDGALQFLPFSALPLPAAFAKADATRGLPSFPSFSLRTPYQGVKPNAPLLQAFEVIHLPARRSREINGLKLNAELLILSACNTEGIKPDASVGLTHGFLRVEGVATCWKIHEAATATLLRNFYQGMLSMRGAQQLTPAAALRQAQLALWREPKWQSPHYWAAFVLQGEW